MLPCTLDRHSQISDVRNIFTENLKRNYLSAHTTILYPGEQAIDFFIFIFPQALNDYLERLSQEAPYPSLQFFELFVSRITAEENNTIARGPLLLDITPEERDKCLPLASSIFKSSDFLATLTRLPS